MIADWDAVARLVAVGASLLLIVLLVTGAVRRPLKLALAGLLAGSVAYLVNSAPQFAIHAETRPWIDLAAIFTPFWT